MFCFENFYYENAEVCSCNNLIFEMNFLTDKNTIIFWTYTKNKKVILSNNKSLVVSILS